VKILLLGCNGQVGWELQRSLAPVGELVALGREGAEGLVGDLTDLEGLAKTVRTVSPDVVVNAAAYNAVDRAETEPEISRTVNARAPATLAREVKALGGWLVHYSTDYVFDGSGDRPWREQDPTGPLNGYGVTKLEGEEAVRMRSCRHLIFRTSWVYAARGHNFIHTILRLAREREQLDVIDDQVGAPAGAELIADVTAHALRSVTREPDLGGTYHLAARGEPSWWGYARFIIEFVIRAGLPLRSRPESLSRVTSEAFPRPATRPRNSRLDTTRLQCAFDLRLPPWEHGVSRVLAEILQEEGNREPKT
jgi:dTDP-4-dehydrorhamnose reductase